MDITDIEVDFKIHDAYVSFSAEVVRIALLSPALFAFFVALAGEHPTAETVAKLLAPARCSVTVGFSFMAVAVFFGLAHRYCAVDFMATYIDNARDAKSSKGDWRLAASSFAIWAAPFCLVVGAAMLFKAVFQIAFQS
jgi:hypothetical protein